MIGRQEREITIDAVGRGGAQGPRRGGVQGANMMAENALKLGEPGFAGDDHVLPFQVEGLDVRGRAV